MATDQTLKDLQIIGSTDNERKGSGWDLRNAPRNYTSLVATQTGSSIFAFAAVFIITRYLGSEGYGGIVAMIAASQISQAFVNWTAVGVIRFGVDEFIDSAKISQTFWTRLLVLLANLALLLVTSPLWFPFLADWLALSEQTFYLVLIHFGATAIWLHIQMSLQGAKMPRQQGYLIMIERSTIFAALLGLVFVDKLTPFSAMYCYIAGPVLMIFAGTMILRRLIFSAFELDRSFVRELLLFSLPLLPYNVIGLFATGAVDAIFVSKLLTTRDLGYLAVAAQISGVALQLPTLANSLLLPFFVSLYKENQVERSEKYFAHTLPILVLGWGLMTTVAALLAYFAMPRILGDEFQASAGPLWILLANSTLNIPILLGYAAISNAASLTYIAMVGGILASAVNLVLNFILIPVIGIEGSAWATSMIYLATSATFAILLRRDLGTQASWTFLAMIPALVGSISITITSAPLLSATLCFSLSLFLLAAKKESLKTTVDMIKTMWVV